MGRPLNKKYFGNTNTSTTGGEGISSYGTIVAGSGWTAQPTPSISTPNEPDGVQAVATVHYKALSFATTANGSGYNIGDIVEVNSGTASIAARAPVAEIIGVTTTLVDGGHDYDVGNTITMSGAGWSHNLVITVTAIKTVGLVNGVIDTFTVSAGRRTVAAPTNPVSGTTAQGGGSDANGADATFNLGWGVYSFGAVSVVGDYTVFPDAASALTSIAPATGTNATADITLGLLSVQITNPGSGYTNASDAALSFSPAATPTNASAVAVLASTQKGAILAYAWIGGARRVVDIIKQESSQRYKVDARGYEGSPKFAKLVAHTASGSPTWTNSNVEMEITATDFNGNNYWVTKLTAHKAQLTRKISGSGDFATGSEVQWTFNGANGTKVYENQPYLQFGVNVQIDNA